MKQRMKESHRKGVAIHPDLESWAGGREAEAKRRQRHWWAGYRVGSGTDHPKSFQSEEMNIAEGLRIGFRCDFRPCFLVLRDFSGDGGGAVREIGD
jgi:hypothetical protein